MPNEGVGTEEEWYNNIILHLYIYRIKHIIFFF